MKDLAAALKASNDWVVFDTETTGLDNRAEVVQIGLVAPDGTVLLDALVKPLAIIPAEVTAIHGIGEADVTGAPDIWELEPDLRALMEGKRIVCYNAPYDSRMLRQSFTAHLPKAPAWVEALEFVDIMEPYADFWGDWNEYRGNNKWQRLSAACSQQEVPVTNAHNAVGDCQMALALINRLADPEWEGCKCF